MNSAFCLIVSALASLGLAVSATDDPMSCYFYHDANTTHASRPPSESFRRYKQDETCYYLLIFFCYALGLQLATTFQVLYVPEAVVALLLVGPLNSKIIGQQEHF